MNTIRGMVRRGIKAADNNSPPMALLERQLQVLDGQEHLLWTDGRLMIVDDPELVRALGESYIEQEEITPGTTYAMYFMKGSRRYGGLMISKKMIADKVQSGQLKKIADCDRRTEGIELTIGEMPSFAQLRKDEQDAVALWTPSGEVFFADRRRHEYIMKQDPDSIILDYSLLYLRDGLIVALLGFGGTPIYDANSQKVRLDEMMIKLYGR